MALLNVDGVKFAYKKKEVLKKMSLEINEGDFMAVLGPNGSGKSTLLKLLSRNLKPDGGSVFYRKEKITSMDTKALARRLAILVQGAVAPPDILVKDMVSYGRYPHQKWWRGNTQEDLKIIAWAMARTKVQQFALRRMGELSGGERQRVFLAMALAQKPEIILLDEPTTYLDIAHQLELLELVRELNKEEGLTVVAVLHDVAQAARYAEKVVLMEQGKIMAMGSPREVINPENLRRLYGVEVEVCWDQQGLPRIFIKGLAR
ncbi:ATP-binding cassette domain-containing protein [Thermanaerosceptrum fracticalcis]|uniref:ATP-binding cassette domain-containing protein n=1 Tax=Thermanaerosceptrum fracticalcis TaxID=1712410 RepID=A0A7G6E3M9_THEFR|nr:ABC transporter ATP-binding protein [Thermanaerosceptrum fracticalcis]QNB46683.1 ATP-binding cassette domain-containing protein [Thermanaerosceptrum fracticalcis]